MQGLIEEENSESALSKQWRQLEPTRKNLKWFLGFHCLCITSVIYLASSNIRSYYFLLETICLFILSFLFLVYSWRTILIFNEKTPSFQRKKCAIIALQVVSFCIGVASANYLVYSSQVQWCNQIITYNGSATESSIHWRLVDKGTCGNGKSTADQAYAAVQTLCWNKSNCSKSDLIITGYSQVIAAASINMVVYFIVFICGATYFVSKLNTAMNDFNRSFSRQQGTQQGIETNSFPQQLYGQQQQQYYSQQQQPRFYYANQPQIYQADILPYPQFDPQQVVVGQPIQQQIYYK